MENKLTVPPSVIFTSLVRRAARGRPNTKLGRCARCQGVTRHHIAAEVVTTNEEIWTCGRCGLRQCL